MLSSYRAFNLVLFLISALVLCSCDGDKHAPQRNPVPYIDSFSPSEATAGNADFILTIIGTGFVSGSMAQWNGSDRPTAFIAS